MGLKVIVTTNEATARQIVLCDSPDPIPTFNIQLNGRGIIDRQDLFQADYGANKNLGGWRNALSFETTRTNDENGVAFGTSLAALRYLFKHQNDIRNITQAKFILTDGGDSDTWYLKGAQITTFNMGRLRNLVFNATYAIEGGELSQTAS